MAKESLPLVKSIQEIEMGMKSPYQYSSLSSSNSTENLVSSDEEGPKKSRVMFIAGSCVLAVFSLTVIFSLAAGKETPSMEKGAWSSKAEPFSNMDPVNLGFKPILRPKVSLPGAVFGDIYQSGSKDNKPLPTNAWYQNFLLGTPTSNTKDNSVFAVPYVVDVAGLIPGLRSHACTVMANKAMVRMNYEPENGLTIGAVEKFETQHHVRNPSLTTPRLTKLAIELEWKAWGMICRWTGFMCDYDGPKMRAAVVRGAPYTSMEYLRATPRLHSERPVSGALHVDGGSKTLLCGEEGAFSTEPVWVEKELRMQFEQSDYTWLVFVSEPAFFKCATSNAMASENQKGTTSKPFFELRAMEPMTRGMMRVAMGNNCTAGKNPTTCSELGKSWDQSDFMDLLRKHSDVYPTSEADVEFTFPVQSEVEEELRLIFNWRPALMSKLKDLQDDDRFYPALNTQNGLAPEIELLTYAIPHQQERLRFVIGSSNFVHQHGCVPTIHGQACPAVGGLWSMLEHLHRVSLHADRVPRPELIEPIKKALQKDILYEIPANYRIGAGDTYFSGKMLGKLARILVVAGDVGGVDDKLFKAGVERLKSGVEVWLNGSAAATMTYDTAWGGIVSCGCDYEYDKVKYPNGRCKNTFPNCPSLTDPGQNFGAGFYNDHHFHYGYHIYAAAVAAKYDNAWGRKYHQHVLMLVRDIANPSNGDDYFPKWRHKDWYLGFSWASGIVTVDMQDGSKIPYPNGRNQESSSEAVHAYEAVALYGHEMSKIFENNVHNANSEESGLYESALRVRDMGRLLMATEIRSARTYWQVQPVGTPGVARVYPKEYEPMVVGMMWSMMVQEQTWFGNEAYLSYGIQMMPLTNAAEQRDNVDWVSNMLPLYNESCSQYSSCAEQGWSIITYACAAELGQWEYALNGLEALEPEVFESAGGNGHSLSNSLWFIATRNEDDVQSTQPFKV